MDVQLSFIDSFEYRTLGRECLTPLFLETGWVECVVDKRQLTFDFI